MAIIIGIVLCLFSIAVLLYPFWKAPRARSVAATLENAGLESDGGSPQELEPVYQAIRTLQLEHQLGRIPDSSFSNQLEAYRIEAAEILRSRARESAKDGNQDPVVSGESEEAALEQEILLARARMAHAPISAGPVTEESDRPETIA